MNDDTSTCSNSIRISGRVKTLSTKGKQLEVEKRLKSVTSAIKRFRSRHAATDNHDNEFWDDIQ